MLKRGPLISMVVGSVIDQVAIAKVAGNFTSQVRKHK